jgi:hypothetical protein
MNVRFTILHCGKILFKGILVAEPGSERDKEKLAHDIYNVERIINNQGFYRCHTEIVNPEDKT